jgi:hypothetical protein
MGWLGSAGTWVTVTLDGTGLLGGGGSRIAQAALGGSAVTSVSFLSNFTIYSMVVVRAGIAGPSVNTTATVVLTVNSGVLLILVQAWTYVRSEVVNGAVPNSGQVVTRVAISGCHLGSAAARRRRAAARRRRGAVVCHGWRRGGLGSVYQPHVCICC